MRILMTSTAALVAAATGPALAGNPVPATEEPAVIVTAPAPAPTPDWTGFYAGGQLGYGDYDWSNGSDLSLDGATGGLHAGYNHDFGGFILGGEAQIDAANLEDAAGTTAVDRMMRVKLRAGPDLGDTFLYGTVGIAHASLDDAGTDREDTGYTVGAGIDYRLTRRWSVGGEVLFDRFDDFDDTGNDLEGTSLRARVSYNF